MTQDLTATRLTQYASGGGCACKVPPGELERVLAGLAAPAGADGDLLVGLENGDDGAVVRIEDDRARRAHRRLLHARSSTTPTTGAGSPRPTRSPTSTRWAATRSSP